jgi:hypothetical protein
MEIIITLLTLYSIAVTIMLVRANSHAKYDILKIPNKNAKPSPWGDAVWAELAFGEPKNEN